MSPVPLVLTLIAEDPLAFDSIRHDARGARLAQEGCGSKRAVGYNM